MSIVQQFHYLQESCVWKVYSTDDGHIDVIKRKEVTWEVWWALLSILLPFVSLCIPLFLPLRCSICLQAPSPYLSSPSLFLSLPHSLFTSLFFLLSYHFTIPQCILNLYCSEHCQPSYGQLCHRNVCLINDITCDWCSLIARCSWKGNWV